MLTWSLAIPLNPALPRAIFLQIAQGIAQAVAEGRLRPGDPLPSIRMMAQELGVNRNTVLSAYQELAAEGLLVSRPGGASLVADPLPSPAPRPLPVPARGAPVGFSLPPQPGGQAPLDLPRAVLDCFTGHADLRMLPMAALSRAYAKAMRSAASGRERGSPQGLPKLRGTLAAMLAQTKGLPASAGSLLIGDGIQGTLDLLARGLISPGDRVAVEDPGGTLHREVFRRAGADLVPIPVDRGGLDLEALRAALEQGGLKALLVTPQCQYPTTVPLAPERRGPLLALAREHRFAIIELDQDGDFHYEGAPILPLASEDPQGTVIYVSAFSKVLFPNLPLAFLHAPEPVIAHLVRWRQAVETGRDPLLELAVAELLEEGEIQRLLHRLRRTCHQRRDHLAAELRRSLGHVLRFTPPRCGMSFWAEAAPGLDAEAWAAKALRLGLAIRTGREFTFDGSPLNCLRFGFGALSETELEEAVARLAGACPREPERPGHS